MSAAIVVESLSKRYLLKHRLGQPPAYRTLREALSDSAARFGRLLRGRNGHAGESEEPFWALRDVSFIVEEAERVAVIGRNGAGKTTLLKLLSRITEPTSGSIRIRGRLSGLLEVGTGFHPELTGRENIFLNGAVLGMSRAEVRRRFDEIVAFAEMDRFLDTPVKRYSSGMYVRLAFAVAAHLDPDVLILDEVLAVGDYQFQRKCFGKIREISSDQGRTVLLVSHNMAAVRSLCSRAILLESGSIKSSGAVEEVIGVYEEFSSPLTTFGRVDLREWKNRTHKNAVALIEWAEFNLENGNQDKGVQIGSDIRVSFGVRFDRRLIGKRIRLSVELGTSYGFPISNMVDEDSGFCLDSARDVEAVSVILRDVRFYPGLYSLSLWVGSSEAETLDWVHDCISFEVAEGGPLARRQPLRGAGLIFLTPQWERL